MQNQEKVLIVFDGQLEKLDGYFHNKIRKAKVHDDIELLKEDLIQDTFAALWLKVKDEHYDEFDLLALIWLKAKDIWQRFIKKKRIDILDTPIESLPERSTSIDPLIILERKDLLAAMQSRCGTPETWEMMSYHHADGFIYTEIAKFFDMKKGTVKMRVGRLKADIIQISW
jgi:DNA-directed RNA polymerase specialized sigma24 family protein